MKKGAAVLLPVLAIVAAAIVLLPPSPPPCRPASPTLPERADSPPPPLPLPTLPRKPSQKVKPQSTPMPAGGLTEERVKAALLYQFLLHVTWPTPDPGKEDDPLLLGILGVSSVGDTLHTTTMDKQIGRRRIIVVRGNDLADLPPCQLLFIPEGWKQDWDMIMPAVCKPGVLIVGEEEGFLEAGGEIALRLENGKIRFALHPGNVRSAGVKVDTRLIELASPLVK